MFESKLRKMNAREVLLGAVVAGVAAVSTGVPTAMALTAEAPHSAERSTIGSFAENAGNFGTLLALAEAAGLSDALVGNDDLTVFAPTDEAFAKLPAQTRENLLRPANRELLRTILLYHAVDGAFSSGDIIGDSGASTLQGQRVDAGINEGRFQIGGANVVANDVRVGNGVIHAIDTVLIPDGVDPNAGAGRLVIGIYNDHPGAALRSQLGIPRGTGLVVTGLVNGQPAGEVLKKFDVITRIDGEPATEGELNRAKKRAGFGGSIELTVLREGRLTTKVVGVAVEKH